MSSFIKELLAITLQEKEESVEASDLKIDDQVHNQLDKEAETDHLDAQCFGLEMEDGQVVKVYVKPEDAEEFESALSVALGEDDDIENALEELGKKFEIIEIKWPDESTEENIDSEEAEEEDDEDGSSSLNSEVDYDDDGEKDGKGKKQESVSLGRRFTNRLTEIKWDDVDATEYKKASKTEPDDGDETDAEPAEKPQAEQGSDKSWKIEKDEKGLTISNDRFSIDLDDHETTDLAAAISDTKIARFKNEHGKVVYVFSPKGNEYILKTPEYQGGFRIPADILDQITSSD
jgi:hypothetical protein